MPATMDVEVGEDSNLGLVEVEISREERADLHTAKVEKKVAYSIRPKSIKMTEDFISN